MYSTAKKHVMAQPWRRIWSGFVFVFFACSICLLLVRPAAASELQNRSLRINTPVGSATAQYIFTFSYVSGAPVGSVAFEFCDTPLPAQPCVLPTGMVVHNVFLGTQTGDMGFTMQSRTTNRVVIGRAPHVPWPGSSSYLFDNVTNPSPEPQTVFVRITTYSSSDGSGAYIDEGVVASSTEQDVEVYTQVPPILIFCVATVIRDDECSDMEGNYTDLGQLSATKTSKLTAQMEARTNARSGYSIQMMGNTMTSGVNTIPALTAPTSSVPGIGQFGMNMTTNSSPVVGADPSGPGANAIVNAAYMTPNKFLFQDGDVLVTTLNPTRSRKFTMSYIVNIPTEQALGVYSTTVTFICVGSF